MKNILKSIINALSMTASADEAAKLKYLFYKNYIDSWLEVENDERVIELLKKAKCVENVGYKRKTNVVFSDEEL